MSKWFGFQGPSLTPYSKSTTNHYFLMSFLIFFACFNELQVLMGLVLLQRILKFQSALETYSCFPRSKTQLLYPHLPIWMASQSDGCTLSLNWACQTLLPVSHPKDQHPDPKLQWSWIFVCYQSYDAPRTQPLHGRGWWKHSYKFIHSFPVKIPVTRTITPLLNESSKSAVNISTW